MGWTPATFWRSTPTEFFAALKIGEDLAEVRRAHEDRKKGMRRGKVTRVERQAWEKDVAPIRAALAELEAKKKQGAD